jgi:hypothetical protein
MESFFTFLEKRVDDSSSLLCVGLDPHIPDLKEPTAASALDFCLTLVKQTAPYAAAFKPNAAFFEVFGADGWSALRQVIEAVQAESQTRRHRFHSGGVCQIRVRPSWRALHHPEPISRQRFN